MIGDDVISVVAGVTEKQWMVENYFNLPQVLQLYLKYRVRLATPGKELSLGILHWGEQAREQVSHPILDKTTGCV